MEAAGSTRVTRQFQVTIPKKAREVLKIKEGDILLVYVDASKKEVVLRKG
ncbi:MAG: AbrB/MazE/SpoVT family DNA-binding domain-containing protein [Nitrososphaerota archaeon]